MRSRRQLATEPAPPDPDAWADAEHPAAQTTDPMVFAHYARHSDPQVRAAAVVNPQAAALATAGLAFHADPSEVVRAAAASRADILDDDTACAALAADAALWVRLALARHAALWTRQPGVAASLYADPAVREVLVARTALPHALALAIATGDDPGSAAALAQNPALADAPDLVDALWARTDQDARAWPRAASMRCRLLHNAQVVAAQPDLLARGADDPTVAVRLTVGGLAALATAPDLAARLADDRGWGVAVTVHRNAALAPDTRARAAATAHALTAPPPPRAAATAADYPASTPRYGRRPTDRTPPPPRAAP